MKNTIIPPPDLCHCGSAGCITLLKVIHLPSNRELVGAFSQFGEVKGRTKQQLVLRDDYRYSRWIVNCADCHERATA